MVAIQALRKLDVDHAKIVTEYKANQKMLRTEMKAQLLFHDLVSKLRLKEMEGLPDTDTYVEYPYQALDRKGNLRRYKYIIPKVLGPGEVDESVFHDRLCEISTTWGYNIAAGISWSPDFGRIYNFRRVHV